MTLSSGLKELEQFMLAQQEQRGKQLKSNLPILIMCYSKLEF